MPGKPEGELAQDPRRRRLIQGAAGTLVLALGVPSIARGATLLAVRIWPAQDYTRVTIEHDAPLKFSQFLLRDAPPLRLVVDVEGIDLTPKFAHQVADIDQDDPYIARVRVGQNRPKVVRLVIELKTDVKPQVFLLEPVGPYQYRLVLDLYPAQPTDPLLALLQSASDGAVAAPAESPDTAGRSEAAAPPQLPPPDDAALERQIENAVRPQAPADSHPAETPAPATAPAGAPSPSAPRVTTPAGRRLITIAVDPGHGGEDPGAIGRHGTYEKTVTLSIGRRLAAMLHDEKDFRVLMTRDADFFVPLAVRVDKARRVQADLFVSIHADAWIKSDARGSSVFALSERGASSTAAAWLANHENQADLIGGVNLAAHDQQIARVLLDLSTSAQISDSLRFGGAVLHELEHVNRLHRGRVEQASFAVLKAPDIPSILVETAFISNPDEEARLRDERYQNQMAQAIFLGIRDYFAKNPPPMRNPVG
jgi:N-acetylmuramoyl-L-alanine amidase